MLIEVAESSLTYHRETKAPLYASSGVPEYWIVDVSSRTLEVYSSPQGERYASLATFTGQDILRPQAFADVEIRVAQLFD
ncbi:MAG: Uma2 family endonuclease [Labilithrix sp.]|nr:Uma2 family endonuclease [Labilithrix sp.]MCW5813242.1 Uma2 family endonuclease [Labilithrix sp.]